MPQRIASRIGLLGGECTGKTTLATHLAAALDGCLVTEALRDFVAENGRPPRSDEQAGLLAQQVHREEAVAAACAGAVVVADPAPLMTAVYSLLYFDDPSLVAAGVEHAQGYDLLVWCAPDLPWTPDDGQRDGPAHREDADRIIGRLVTEHLEPAGVRVVRVQGPPEDRVAAVRLAWQPGPLQGLT